MTHIAADKPKLLQLLEQLAGAVEELLLAGLTTACETTRQTLAVALQEASRRQLLRLASTLRIANEELGRFTRNEADFSRQRLMFFLNRAWLLARGLRRALHDEDQALYDRLLWTPASVPVERLEVVTLGVGKKVAARAFVAFEFRLRTMAASAVPGGELPAGHRLAWSCIFPVKPGVDIPPEGFLHLPQKQKFNASVFLERKSLVLERVAVALDEFGGGRISLGDESRVSAGAEFTAWDRFLEWSPAVSIQRIARHEVSPFDLEVEVQEEVVLRDWEIGAGSVREESGQTVFPITCGPVQFDAVVSPGSEGEALAAALSDLRKLKVRPPLFGLMHYELCRLVLQPLALIETKGPKYLTISDKNIDRKQLLKALKFV
ncbi:MAG: hypothetical protein MUE50_23285 [Pirellulaceae bacterium]|nr:hypothetical protein [Pirellulaceae bacterium]